MIGVKKKSACVCTQKTNKEEVRVENSTSVVSKSPMCELRRATAGPTNGSQSLQERKHNTLDFCIKITSEANKFWLEVVRYSAL